MLESAYYISEIFWIPTLEALYPTSVREGGRGVKEREEGLQRRREERGRKGNCSCL